MFEAVRKDRKLQLKAELPPPPTELEERDRVPVATLEGTLEQLRALLNTLRHLQETQDHVGVDAQLGKDGGVNETRRNGVVGHVVEHDGPVVGELEHTGEPWRVVIPAQVTDFSSPGEAPQLIETPAVELQISAKLVPVKQPSSTTGQTETTPLTTIGEDEQIAETLTPEQPPQTTPMASTEQTTEAMLRKMEAPAVELRITSEPVPVEQSWSTTAQTPDQQPQTTPMTTTEETTESQTTNQPTQTTAMTTTEQETTQTPEQVPQTTTTAPKVPDVELQITAKLVPVEDSLPAAETTDQPPQTTTTTSTVQDIATPQTQPPEQEPKTTTPMTTTEDVQTTPKVMILDAEQPITAKLVPVVDSLTATETTEQQTQTTTEKDLQTTPKVSDVELQITVKLVPVVDSSLTATETPDQLPPTTTEQDLATTQTHPPEQDLKTTLKPEQVPQTTPMTTAEQDLQPTEVVLRVPVEQPWSTTAQTPTEENLKSTQTPDQQPQTTPTTTEEHIPTTESILKKVEAPAVELHITAELVPAEESLSTTPQTPDQTPQTTPTPMTSTEPGLQTTEPQSPEQAPQTTTMTPTEQAAETTPPKVETVQLQFTVKVVPVEQLLTPAQTSEQAPQTTPTTSTEQPSQTTETSTSKQPPRPTLLDLLNLLPFPSRGIVNSVSTKPAQKIGNKGVYQAQPTFISYIIQPVFYSTGNK